MSALSILLGVLAMLGLVPLSDILWRYRNQNGSKLRWQLAWGMWLVCAGAATERLIWDYGILLTIVGLLLALKALWWERLMALLGR